MATTDVTSTEPEAAPPLCPDELAAWKGLLRVHASLMKALDAELESAHRLPLTSYEVLIQLADAPERRMRMCDLADSVLLSRSGMSRLVDRLERDGLLERAACANDARGSFAVITPAGLELLDEARPTHHEGIRRRFLAHFSEQELEQLGSLWTRVLAAQPTSSR
ncbi:DNA-binding MarR family transcriptional regulator [Conexibacter arvalis]|uniref:DNA-binding MarR family transcriptional regulator n=1 Tax=Conexibacter arvalis TaxID=912552 RepID=A0A840IK33_9ACTN|nr:MarR family transcriptional regulator [Conexibacter arvalis]MBB4664503.1 DNA-binding MarR family transcriptional regulator [Conexibacter arvalis]